MVTKEQAIEIAREFVVAEIGRELKCYGAHLIDESNFAELLGIPFDDNVFVTRKYWAVAFETRLADGTVADGPTSVAVDLDTGKAKFS